MEYKAIRKQNAGNINENGDFCERLKMKKERKNFEYAAVK